MDKSWLIRTQRNKLLGPVTKDQLIDFITKGSLKPDDEICSGNGYWFYIRENQLVDKFITREETQPFNPISEAKDILSAKKGIDLDEALLSSPEA